MQVSPWDRFGNFLGSLMSKDATVAVFILCVVLWEIAWRAALLALCAAPIAALIFLAH